MKMPKHIVLRVDVEGTTISLTNVTKGVEVCEDSISRKQVLTYIADTQLLKSGESTFDGATACDWLFDYIKELPSVIPSRPKGEWIELGQNKDGTHNICCGACGGKYKSKGHARSYYTSEKYKYCPNCGADMRGDNNE